MMQSASAGGSGWRLSVRAAASAQLALVVAAARLLYQRSSEDDPGHPHERNPNKESEGQAVGPAQATVKAIHRASTAAMIAPRPHTAHGTMSSPGALRPPNRKPSKRLEQQYPSGSTCGSPTRDSSRWTRTGDRNPWTRPLLNARAQKMRAACIGTRRRDRRRPSHHREHGTPRRGISGRRHGRQVGYAGVGLRAREGGARAVAPVRAVGRSAPARPLKTP
jgi:hypothetical protein